MSLAVALASLLWAQAVPVAPAVVAPPAASVPAPLPIELRWTAPAGCPDLESVRAGIAHGLPPTPTGMEPMQVDVLVRTLGDHWQAALALRGMDWTATRTLNGATCAAVADAVGLVIGLAFTSQLASNEVVLPPPPPPPPPAPPLSTPFVALAAAADTGALSSATSGGALSLGWRFTHARLGVEGSLFASRTTTVAARADTGGRLSLASLAARGCALWGTSVSLGPCVAAGVDRLHGAGFGPIAAAEATSLAPFLAGGLRAEERLSRWVAVFVAADLVIPLVRARFSVENVGLVHQSSATMFRGAAGIEVRFR